jgi:hypothetical protein
VGRPEIFCWVFSGRTPRSLRLFVGQLLVSAVKRRTSSRWSRQNSSSPRQGLCFTVFPRAWDAGDGGEADGDSAAELQFQGLAVFGGDGGKSLLAGRVPGTDEAAQRPPGLLGPASARVVLGVVLHVAVTKLGSGGVQSWAGDINAILREAHRALETARVRGDTALDQKMIDDLRERYDTAVKSGMIHNRLRDWDHRRNRPYPQT